MTNVKNFCFKYAILSKYNKRENHKNYFSLELFKTLENQSGLNFKCLNFPRTLNEIKIFERTNDIISVNVYGVDN